jgi:formate dehydrogenase major subunit
VVEIMNAAKKHEIRGMYVMGENPAMSDPDVDHAREALASLDHLVVQDIFLTETAYLADVVLAATAWPEKVGTVTNTDRMVQLGRKAIEPPGEAKEDFWLLNELGRRIGLDWHYTIRARCSTRCGRAWTRSPASPGIASNASRR